MARRQQLIDRRDELGLTQDGVAREAGLTENTIRRYELGLSTPRGGDRVAYARALGWSPERLAVALADEPHPVNGHSVPGWLGHLASLEQGAAELRAWESLVVHGLLQTSDYATAVEIADVTARSPDAVAERVRTRLARQAALHRDDPLRLHVVLDESVLLRVAGSREVMAAQLDHLAEMAERPNVTIQILPLTAGRFSAAFGAFSLFIQPGATEPYMAVSEDRAGPHYLDRPHELEAHTALFTHLSTVALDPDSTIDLIRRMAKEYR